MQRILTENGMAQGLLSRSSDIILAFVVVAIIALMILPLPLAVLDSLVALNIALGVMLVLMAIYVSSPLQFSVFPSVLLISTLFRLALSVATTRMILLNGDAGSIIETFGGLVAGGNVVVGLVVFLIITLVQFLVIAKGAERVAEVGARFTLDAMPGKQMSIDSDLRSGLIDKTEARSKRDELELESKLHGSMDGAMKFVKGDAIAGIVIIIINLIGGLAIGVFQLDMSAGQAMQKYSILTIGDGMVAQIPALLGAMSAGLIVTRVTDQNNDKHLGDSIQKQFAAIPRVLLVAGAMCLIFALVPGFPSIVFLLLGGSLILIGVMLVPALRKQVDRLSGPTFETVMNRKLEKDSTVVESRASSELQHAVPLLLELPASFAAQQRDEQLRDKLNVLFNQHQAHSGLPMPPLRFDWRHDDSDSWFLYAYEVPIASDTISPDTTLDEIVDTIHLSIRQHGSLFMGIQETSRLLSEASNEYPDIVKEAARVIPMQNMATIFRNLIDEEIPINNMRSILEALIGASQHEKDPTNLTEFARIALSRQLCHRYAPKGDMKVVALAPELEEYLLGNLRTTSGVQQLSLDPATVEQIRQAVLTAIDEHKPAAVVTAVQLRKHCRVALAQHAFDTPILSYNELVPTLQLEIAKRVSVDKLPKTSVSNAAPASKESSKP